MATTASAVELVFGTAELLEAILLSVDPRTILRSQQVNDTFRLTIQRSSPIQHKLFMALGVEREFPLDRLGPSLIVCTCRTDRHGKAALFITCELTRPPWGEKHGPGATAIMLPGITTLPPGQQRYLRGSWEDLRPMPMKGRPVKAHFERAWKLGVLTKVTEQVWEGHISGDLTLGEVVAKIITRPQKPGERGGWR
ncbi:hypothetical protein LTR85_008172 [Meristemomyces frigidus]|nr:hypothetical protein LTR85_008172 [Meristemomyces frigidus]